LLTSGRQGLIAVNYPAKEFGISRMCTVQDAKKLCPELISQHVATWREGDEKWAYVRASCCCNRLVWS
jgi:DNA polymerase eta